MGVLVGSLSVYLVVISALPVYNKFIYSLHFKYPLTLTAMQFTVVSLILVAASCVRRLCHSSKDGTPPPSWFFGPHLRYKLQTTIPLGVLFGLKGSLTNWALSLIDTGTHNLLQATELVWACLFASIVNRERPNCIGLIAVVGAIASTVLISASKLTGSGKSSSGNEDPVTAFAIILNVICPVVGGLTVCVLRCVHLPPTDDC